MASEVYFCNFRTTLTENIPQKLRRLITAAGMGKIDFAEKFTAIKLHLGEPGNLAFLRPNFAKVVVDLIHEKGGKCFLTDCNTLYVGGRKNALDHLDAADENGWSPLTTGCHVIIADGLKGTDEAIVPLEGGDYVQQAKIGRALMDADIVVSLTHFKGHEGAGFGGALKNLGMGGGSRAGKMEMHSNGKPTVDHSLCVGCGMCVKNCAHGAITITNKKATIDHTKCVGCGRCIGVCFKNATSAPWDGDAVLNAKIAEYTAAILRGRPHFHISIVNQVSPYCDCHTENDAPIVPDVGMFASFDPVALDQACVDAVNKMPALAGSILDERAKTHQDHFTDVHPTTNWKTQLEHGEKLKLGSRTYQLIEI
jgi:uncharacterized Fe-S center protein